MRTDSQPNVSLEGNHAQERSWFSGAAAAPILSMSAERAARRIVRACVRGERSLELGLVTKLAVRAEALAPSMIGAMMELVNRMLSKTAGAEGDVTRSGWQSPSAYSPSLLTRLADRQIP